MVSNWFFKISGTALILSGAAYVIDTVLDAYLPASSPGLGALVPVLGLLGFPGFWLSLKTGPRDGLALGALVLGMLGLAGLVIVTFLNNRLFPDLPPEARMQILTAIRPELLVIGLTFLASALCLLPLGLRSDRRNALGAVLYALGAIPVSLPPLMPPQLVNAGGLAVAAGLILWGIGLIVGAEARSAAAVPARV